jgi:DNA-binding transcriptional MerR regulator
VAKSEPQLYKPADACRMAEVAPYVLRYWETEFSALSEGKEKEGKEKGGTRLYTARDVQIIARIRQLLYDEGFTVAGAKKRLDMEIQEGRFDDSGKPPAVATRAAISVPTKATPPPPPPARPAVVATPPAPAPRPTPVQVAPSAPPTSFPERKAVIKELKEIVRLLEKPKKG